MTHWEDLFVVAAGPQPLSSRAPASGIGLVVHARSGRCRTGSGGAGRVRPTGKDGCATTVQVFPPADGGLAALHVAARYLSASDGLGAALVTADHTAPPPPGAFSAREPAVPTGAVVARGAGAARVLSTVFLGGPPEGALFRGDLTWREPGAGRRTLRRLPARRRVTGHVPPLGAPEREAVARAVDEAGATPADVARVIHTPDQLTALADLLNRGREAGAPLVVLAGVGRGQDFGCVVLKPL